MGPGADNMNDGTSYQPSEPIPCANGCGFFGTPATMNLCSKCYRDFLMKEEQATAAKVALDKFVTPQGKPAAVIDVKPSSAASSSAADEATAAADGDIVKKESTKPSNRCGCCNKKVGVMGFACRCGETFCGIHRYPEKHDCGFDFKGQGREAIAKANPVVKGDKLQRL